MRTAEELRRLDVMVAANVYRWGRYEDPEGDCLPDQGWFSEDPEFPRCGVVPHFTTDPKDCQGLKDKARADGWLMAMRLSGAGNFWTQIWKNGEDPHTTMKNGDASESSELIAWVLACLRAYGVKV